MEENTISKRTLIGKKFKLEVPSKRNSGFRWHVEFDPFVFRLEGSRITPNQDTFGGSGKEEHIFTAKYKGEFSLRFVLRRPWESITYDEIEALIQVE